jgi:hypothetical protein
MLVSENELYMCVTRYRLIYVNHICHSSNGRCVAAELAAASIAAEDPYRRIHIRNKEKLVLVLNQFTTSFFV